MIAAILLWGLTLILTVLTLLPLCRIPHGFVRGADFPRIQILCLAVLGLVGAVFLLHGNGQLWAIALLLLVTLMQARHIVRFTPLWPKQSRRQSPDEVLEPDRHFAILSSNVKKSNRDYQRLIDLVDRMDPDIVILLEVDDAWLSAVTSVRDRYTEVIERPLDNGYGLAVYSRLPLIDATVRELLLENVPSLRTTVELGTGEHFRLYVLHPEPPVPSQGTEGRDGEIGMVGLEVKDDPMPAVVTGDLNDVAWSATTRRFQRISRLLDPRVGRGLYNTFDARFPIFRWPLDHLFHDARFRLVEMQRLPDIGSDHFPIYFKLALTALPEADDTPEEATEEDVSEVEDLVRTESSRKRKPIGEDWEDEE